MEHGGIFAKLDTQPANVNVDGTVRFNAVKRGVIPGKLKQLGAIECASGVTSEGGEELELTWLEVEDAAIHGGLPAPKINGERSDVENLAVVANARRDALCAHCLDHFGRNCRGQFANCVWIECKPHRRCLLPAWRRVRCDGCARSGKRTAEQGRSEVQRRMPALAPPAASR